MTNNKEKFDFEPWDSTIYTDLERGIGPDRMIHYSIYNEEKYKYAHIYNKASTYDDSHYAPYLVYLIGKKAGIDVPETELKACLIPDIKTGLYRDAFYQSSLVYMNGVEKEPFFNRQITFFPFSVIKSFYYNSTGKEEKRDGYNTVEDYINANIHYFKVRQKTPIPEEQKAEIRQRLIDNLMFGLRLGIRGECDIIESKFDNPILNSFYLTSRNMLCLNLETSKADELANMKESDLKQFSEREFPVQYNVTVDRRSSVGEVVRYLYENYPAETEKSYNKLKQFGVYDLKNTLDGFSEMDEAHKKLALKLFEIRQKEIYDIHKEYQEKKVMR